MSDENLKRKIEMARKYLNTPSPPMPDWMKQSHKQFEEWERRQKTLEKQVIAYLLTFSGENI